MLAPSVLPEQAIVALKQVHKIYPNGAIALAGVNLTVAKGTFLLITGRSGSGKSTLLKLLYGAEQPTAGQVWVAGVCVPQTQGRALALLRRKIGIVFQDYKLIPNRTVKENVAVLLMAQGLAPTAIDKQVLPALHMVGMAHKQDCFPHQLSGGEQQRVAIARAIVNRPPLLLADEPTGNLDSANSLQVLRILQKLHDLGVTVVMTSHDRLVIDHFGWTPNHAIVHLNNGCLQ
jgi:cell division transport system ATP-binding protein